MTQQDQPVRLRFDSFELDLPTGELRKEGRLIKLQDQPMKLLILLATRAGELVGRDEIQNALWSDSHFVEFEHGINTAIRKIREALGDDPEKPRFVETLPRKGYRFMAAVVRVGAAGGESYDSAETYPPAQHFTGQGEHGSLPMIGQTISHYYIEKKLGQGGMGVVYRARDTRLNRTVALKMVLPELAADPGLRRRLAAEARAASALSHPVIATVHDFEQVGECAFIIYEYVEGTNLREVMRVRTLDLSEILDICIKIADGLAAAHDAGIVHRDLKPENVMIGKGGRVKILDLGLAKVSLPVAKGTLSAPGPSAAPTMSTPPGLLVGTVNYMSPEQLEAEQVDHRTDVFSFGVMPYELAVGHHPFVGKSPSSTIGNILKEDPISLARWNRQLPPDLDRVIRKCVWKQRRERYQSVRELLVDVENIRRDLTSPVDVATVNSDSELALSARYGPRAASVCAVRLPGHVLFCALLFRGSGTGAGTDPFASCPPHPPACIDSGHVRNRCPPLPAFGDRVGPPGHGHEVQETLPRAGGIGRVLGGFPAATGANDRTRVGPGLCGGIGLLALLPTDPGSAGLPRGTWPAHRALKSPGATG